MKLKMTFSLLMILLVLIKCSKKITPAKIVNKSIVKCSDSLNLNNDLARQNLRGRVAKYNSSIHKAIVKSGKIEFEPKLMSDAVHETSRYNNFGNVDEVVANYLYPKNVPIDDQVVKTKYSYSDKNQKIEEGIYRIDNADAKLLRKIKYRFDANNELIETLKFQGSSDVTGKSIREVDKTNNTSLESDFDAKGALTSTTSLRFDERGNEIERKTFNVKTKITSVELKTYDHRNNEIGYSYDGEIGKFECVYQYDDKDNEIDKVCSSSTGSRHNHYEYEYDAHCNWIKKVEIVNDTPERVTIREFKYY